MRTEGRFDPPSAHVADVGAAPRSGPGLAIALGVLVLLQLAWLALLSPLLLTLVDKGMLSPIGLVAAVVGQLCLASGAFRMVRRGHSGGRLFLSALILLVLNFAMWRKGLDVMALPRAFGMLIATGGALVAWRRGRALAD